MQHCVADVLGLPMSKVVCKVKRVGGGFGGKETRCMGVAMACALASRKTRRPVRAVLERDKDMAMMGHRHPFKGTKFRVLHESPLSKVVIQFIAGVDSVCTSMGTLRGIGVGGLAACTSLHYEYLLLNIFIYIRMKHPRGLSLFP